jgi:hypothetical protein
MSAITEAEAVEKLCPFITVGHAGYPGGTSWRHINCVGSKCMAWRWWEAGEPTGDVSRRGFCGRITRSERP